MIYQCFDLYKAVVLIKPKLFFGIPYRADMRCVHVPARDPYSWDLLEIDPGLIYNLDLLSLLRTICEKLYIIFWCPDSYYKVHAFFIYLFSLSLFLRHTSDIITIPSHKFLLLNFASSSKTGFKADTKVKRIQGDLHLTLYPCRIHNMESSAGNTRKQLQANLSM